MTMLRRPRCAESPGHNSGHRRLFLPHQRLKLTAGRHSGFSGRQRFCRRLRQLNNARGPTATPREEGEFGEGFFSVHVNTEKTHPFGITQFTSGGTFLGAK
jgi:hypothetical protein